jgi:hypothetical protein
VQADPDLYPWWPYHIWVKLDLFRKFPDATKYIALDEAWTMLSGSAFGIHRVDVPHHSEDQRLGDHHYKVTEITSSKIGPAIINNSAT